MEAWYAGHSSLLQKRGGLFKIHKKEANLTSKCWQASHLMQWKTHYWNLPKTQVLFQLFILFFIFIFFKLRKNTLWTPFLVRLQWTQKSSLNPDVKYKLWEGADRATVKCSVTTPESQAEGFGVTRGDFCVSSQVPPNTYPPLIRWRLFALHEFRYYIKEKLCKKKIMENETRIFYMHAIFIFIFFLLKHLPCPRPCRRLSPSFKGPSEAFLWTDSSYDTRTGGEPTQEARQLAANTATAAAAASLPARVWTAPSPRHQPWCAI